MYRLVAALAGFGDDGVWNQTRADIALARAFADEKERDAAAKKKADAKKKAAKARYLAAQKVSKGHKEPPAVPPVALVPSATITPASPVVIAPATAKATPVHSTTVSALAAVSVGGLATAALARRRSNPKERKEPHVARAAALAPAITTPVTLASAATTPTALPTVAAVAAVSVACQGDAAPLDSVALAQLRNSTATHHAAPRIASVTTGLNPTLATQLNFNQVDIIGRLVAASVVPRGLKNLGNTCFLNSLFQCLLHIVPVGNTFRSHKGLCL